MDVWLYLPLAFSKGISEAQIRVLRTRLRIMQEELDQVSSEFYKKVLHVNVAIVKKSQK